MPRCALLFEAAVHGELRTGVDGLAQAASVLSRAAPSALSPDGQSIYMERAWVRAYVGYSDYRGTGAGGEPLWVRLDPAMKEVRWGPSVDLRGLAHFNFAGYLAGLDARTPMAI